MARIDWLLSLHPDIVVVALGANDGLRGQPVASIESNLREILKIRKQLTPAETLRILEEAASGLSFAYTRGVTHRVASGKSMAPTTSEST